VLEISKSKWPRKYLGVQKGSDDGNSSTNSVDWPNLSVEDDDRRHNNGHMLHGITNAEG
jgi:hypothetical protein